MLSDQPPFDLLVHQATWAAEGVIVLHLVDPDGRRLAPWEPGAHLDLVLPSGLLRQYSLCGDLNDHRTYRIGVLLEANSRGGSREIHETAMVGKRVAARGPRNHFPLVDASEYLFLAGGIGVTPIIPMVQEAERRGTPWHLVYGGRSRRTMAFVDEIGARLDGTYDVVAEDEQGFPDFDALLQDLPAGTQVYCCGPSGMIEAVEKKCAQYLAPGMLHIERFGATPADGSDQQAGNGTFEVELARAGLTLTVPPEQSVLRTVLGAVPSFLYSCEEGYCGTCEALVLEGEPDHRDTVLTDEEKADHKMMICVSRSKSSRLVLDI